MIRLQSYAGAPLSVLQPSIWKQTYELRSGEQVLATMTFTKFLGSEVRMECDQGSWIISQSGIWRPKVIVREAENGITVAEIPVHFLKQEFTFNLRDRSYETVTLRRNFWASTFTMTGRAGRELLSLKQKFFSFTTATITVGPRAKEYDELPWLMFLLWYFWQSTNRSKAHAH